MLEVCWICELFIACFNFLQRVILSFYTAKQVVTLVADKLEAVYFGVEDFG